MCVTESFCCRAEIKKTLYVEATENWIKKFGIYGIFGMMEYYSAMKRNTSESVLMRWMNLEPIIPSEVKSGRKTNIVY